MTCDALNTVNVFDFESEFVDHRRTKTDKCHKLYKYYLSDPDLKTNFLQRQLLSSKASLRRLFISFYKTTNRVVLEILWKICWAMQTEKKKYQWK